MNAGSFLPSLRIALLLYATSFLPAMRAQRPEPASATPGRGAELYTANCVRCHGVDGTKGKWGAKDLRASHLAQDKVQQQVRNGKGIMPAFGKKFTPDDVEAIAKYVMGLRQP